MKLEGHGGKPKIRVWVILTAALASLLVIGGAGGSWFYLSQRAEARPQNEFEAALGRKKRQQPVAEIAPAPVPTAIPFLGREGVDANGYPQKAVDQAGFRSLLHHREFARLSEYLEKLQREFEADPRKEYWAVEGFEAFFSAEAAMTKAIDAWVAATPSSYAPLLARAAHLMGVAQAKRGGGWASETHADNFKQMRETLVRVSEDLDRVLAMNPRLLAAWRYRLSALAFDSHHDELEAAIDQVLRMCPECFQLRVIAMRFVAPRWGGSYERMLEIARAADLAKNPRFRLLPGYVDEDKAFLSMKADKLDQALAQINAACALGEDANFLDRRAEIYIARNELELARADIHRAVELRPNLAGFLFRQAEVEARLRHWEPSGKALIRALRIEPTDVEGRRWVEHVVQGLVYEAGNFHKLGDRASALRLLEIAAALSPKNRTVAQAHEYIVLDGQPPSAETLPELEQKAKQAPDDFGAQQKLDYALARQGKLDRVIELWNTFLTRHPDHGRAYHERAGAFYRLRRFAESRADAERACDLGISEACQLCKEVAKR